MIILGDILKIPALNGTWNKKNIDALLDNSKPVDMANFVYDGTSLVKRQGQTVKGAFEGSLPVTAIYQYKKRDDTSYTLFVMGDGLYKLNGTDAELLATNLYAQASFETWMDNCYIANEDALLKFDGLTVTQLPDVPYGKYILDHNNRLFIAGDPTAPSVVRFSDLLDPTKWPIDNILQFTTDNGADITGMASQNGNLIVFKEDSTHMLFGSGPDEWVQKCVFPSTGCIAPGSIAQIDNNVFFLSKQGVFVITGEGIELISEEIEPVIKAIPDPKSCYGCAFGHQYWLNIGSEVLVYDLQQSNENRIGCWYRFTGMDMASMAVVEGVGGYQELLIGGAAKIYAYSGETDNGKPISAYWKSRKIGSEDGTMVRQFRKIKLEGESPNSMFKFTYSIDGRSPIDVALPSNGSLSLPGNSQGKNIWFKIAHTGNVAGVRVNGLSIESYAKRVRF
jgi:hypothetical protein